MSKKPHSALSRRRDSLGEGQTPRAAQVETGGGSYVGGSVDTGGGAFIGRDQYIINITTTLVGQAEARDIESLPPEPGEPPFQGLQYFTEADAQRFFGREQLTARVVSRLKSTRFLAVIGASGSGKSSLVRAGVIPALKGGQRLADGGLPPPGSGNWAYLALTPTVHPLEALAAALSPPTAGLEDVARLRDDLAGIPNSLTLAARRHLAAIGRGHLLIFIDQFEEVFTLCRKEDEREAFLTRLVEAVEGEDQPPLTILITLRADHYASLARHDRLREVISHHQEFIGAMNREELVRAIDRPLALGGWKIQEGLIEVILDDIGYEPGALPLLSHALYETWMRRRGRTLTLSGYTEAGGVRGAVAQTAEAVFRQLPADQQPVARLIFTRLTEVGEDIPDTRRRASYAELISRATDELVIDAVVKILADARLVITGSAQGQGERVVEVAHEALIREWPTLRRWIDEDRQDLLLQQHLIDDTNDWVRSERDPGLLYRGPRLSQALEWAEKNPDTVSLLIAEFLQASQAAAAEEAARARRLAQATRIQRLFLGLTAVLIAGISYLLFTFIFNKPPAVMDGYYNIAIAQFDLPGLEQNLPEVALDLDQALFEKISAEVGNNPNLLIWHDSPQLRDLKVTIGAVSGADPAERAQSAKDLAGRLNADMVIYPERVDTQAETRIDVAFYLAPRPWYAYEDLQGSFNLGCPFSLSQPETSGPSLDQLSECGSALSWLALGLTEAQLGHSLDALEAFLNARDVFPRSELIQFFLGREYLFLVDRETVLEFARDQFESQAEAAFRQAITINPSYPRGYIGLGSVFAKRARQMVNQFEAGEQPAGVLAQASAFVDQAVANYRQALAASQASPAVGLPLEGVARLGAGNMHNLAGIIAFHQGDPAGALEQFDRAIATLEKTIEPLAADGQARYLTQAYEYLGTAYRWKAHIFQAHLEIDASLEAYQRALDYFDRCIAQGENTQDRIVREEIIAAICVPNRAEVQQILENLRGTQG